MCAVEFFSNAISKHYALVAKNIFAISDIVCTFAAFKINERYDAADKSSQRFLYPHIINRQSNRVVVCGSSNARKDKLVSPEQHHSPYLFNVQNKRAMNAKNRTAGETAMMGASYEERKNYMHQQLDQSGTAILVYFNENMDIRTFGIAEQGSEISLLTMLEQAAFRAQQLAEEVML